MSPTSYRTAPPRVNTKGAYILAHAAISISHRDYQPQPVRQDEELTELAGQCLWDVFSDNHEVIAADGRLVNMGSFRGASAFLDEHVSGDSCSGRESWPVQTLFGTGTGPPRKPPQDDERTRSGCVRGSQETCAGIASSQALP